MTQPLTNKVLLLDVDGLDPRLTSKFLKEGKLPHIKEFVDRGAQKEDLKLICTPHHSGRLWLPALCLSPTGSPASGVRIQFIWTPLATTSTAVSAMQNLCGTLLQKLA